MTLTTYQFPNATDWISKTSVGFDQWMKDIDDLMRRSTVSSYPPFNIRKVVDDTTQTTQFIVEVAVAGFHPDDLEVFVEKNLLTIRGTRNTAESDEAVYLHRGLASRSFERTIAIADTIEVQDCTLLNGVLTITLAMIVPEKDKKKIIAIK